MTTYGLPRVPAPSTRRGSRSPGGSDFDFPREDALFSEPPAAPQRRPSAAERRVALQAQSTQRNRRAPKGIIAKKTNSRDVDFSQLWFHRDELTGEEIISFRLGSDREVAAPTPDLISMFTGTGGVRHTNDPNALVVNLRGLARALRSPPDAASRGGGASRDGDGDCSDLARQVEAQRNTIGALEQALSAATDMGEGDGSGAADGALAMLEIAAALGKTEAALAGAKADNARLKVELARARKGSGGGGGRSGGGEFGESAAGAAALEAERAKVEKLERELVRCRTDAAASSARAAAAEAASAALEGAKAEAEWKAVSVASKLAMGAGSPHFDDGAVEAARAEAAAVHGAQATALARVAELEDTVRALTASGLNAQRGSAALRQSAGAARLAAGTARTSAAELQSRLTHIQTALASPGGDQSSPICGAAHEPPSPLSPAAPARPVSEVLRGAQEAMDLLQMALMPPARPAEDAGSDGGGGAGGGGGGGGGGGVAPALNEPPSPSLPSSVAASQVGGADPAALEHAASEVEEAVAAAEAELRSMAEAEAALDAAEHEFNAVLSAKGSGKGAASESGGGGEEEEEEEDGSGLARDFEAEMAAMLSEMASLAEGGDGGDGSDRGEGSEGGGKAMVHIPLGTN